MRTRNLAATAATSLTLAAFAVTGSPSPSPVSAVTASPIKHVVIIYQENHAFDDVLGAVCQQRATPCNAFDRQDNPKATPWHIARPVTFADGLTADNKAETDISPGIAHTRKAQLAALANRWDYVGGCNAKTTPTYQCVEHYGPGNIPNLAALADKYVVSDQTFASNPSQSFGAHMTLASGTLDGFTGDNPVASKEGVAPGMGWGCTSHKDALWSPTGDFANPVYMPSCVPDSGGNGPYEPTQVKYVPTIMQQMEAAGDSWHIYHGATQKLPLVSPLATCTYFWWCQSTRFTNTYDSNDTYFDSAVANGTLPNLSLMLPANGNSQHNGDSMAQGDNYIGHIVSTIQNSPLWGSTAIFITYDDCGCFYDHVKPNQPNLGIRNPMVIISPYAKSRYTDSSTATQPYSMLAFIDHTFGLPNLSGPVGRAYDYSNSFDFTQSPLTGTPLVHQHISAATKQRVARYNRLHPDDPT